MPPPLFPFLVPTTVAKAFILSVVFTAASTTGSLFLRDALLGRPHPPHHYAAQLGLSACWVLTVSLVLYYMFLYGVAMAASKPFPPFM